MRAFLSPAPANRRQALAARARRFWLASVGRFEQRRLVARVQEAASERHALSAALYGEPPQAIVNAKASRVIENEPGWAMEAILFWGREGANGSLFARVSHLLRGPDGQARVLTSQHDWPAAEGLSTAGLFAQWGIRQRIALARQDGRWLWRSERSRDPRDIVVGHPDLHFDDPAADEALGRLLDLSAQTIIQEQKRRQSAEDARRLARGLRAARPRPEEEAQRLAALLPDDLIGEAIAMGEELALDEETRQASPAAQKTAANPSRASARRM